MEDKTSKRSFDTASKKPVPKRNYTHREVVQKIDRFASVAKTKTQKREVLEMKDLYFVYKEDQNVNRYIRDRNFEMGIRAGIHRRKTLEDMDRGDAMKDQSKRNKTMAQAKRYYHKNYSLSKSFKEGKAKTKTKDKTIDKG